MSNYIYNTMYIRGPRVTEALIAISRPNGAIDLENIIPMPTAIANTRVFEGNEEVALSCAGGDLSYWKSVPWVEKRGITTACELAAVFDIDYEEAIAQGKELLENMRVYGVANWIDWAYENWGCQYFVGGVKVVERLSTTAELSFCTANGTIEPLIRIIARQFPDLTFTLESDDPVGGGWFTFEMKGEKVIEQKSGALSYRTCATESVQETVGEDGH